MPSVLLLMQLIIDNSFIAICSMVVVCSVKLHIFIYLLNIFSDLFNFMLFRPGIFNQYSQGFCQYTPGILQ